MSVVLDSDTRAEIWAKSSLPGSGITKEELSFKNLTADSKSPLPPFQECLLSVREVRDDLVSLFFIHVNAVFPVVDEYSFSETYIRYKNGDLMKQLDPILILTIMFAGFAVNITLLRNTRLANLGLAY